MSGSETLVGWEETLALLGAGTCGPSGAQSGELADRGFLARPARIDPAWLEALSSRVEELFTLEGDRAGSEFNTEPGAPRLADLVNKGQVFDGTYVDPFVLGCAAEVLGRPFKLHSINARDALPGQGAQPLHADWGPRRAEEPYHVVNSLWLLDDMDAGNGATRIVPGTHRLAGSPRDHLAEPAARHPDEVLVEAPRGSVVVFNGHVWHAGTTNRSGRRRRVLHVAYVAAEHPQQLDQRAHLRPSTDARLSAPVRRLLGL